MKLTSVGNLTQLHYQVDAVVGGKLAQIGARLIDSTARKMAKEFFAKFVEIAAGTSTENPTAKISTAALPAKLAQSIRPLVIVAIVVLMAAAAFYLSR